MRVHTLDPTCSNQILNYWELQYGYVPYKEDQEMVPEVEEWLCEENALGSPLGEDLYLDLMYEEAQKFSVEEAQQRKDYKGVGRYGALDGG